MLQADVFTVFIAAMITAIATGLGALPFLFLKSVSDRFIALTNAAAAGLMLAACHGLIAEGIAISPERTLIGVLLGLAGIIIGQRLIDDGHHPDNQKGLFSVQPLQVRDFGCVTVIEDRKSVV